MFDFRLKRVQAALADGRLDEAFEVLADPALREQHFGQKLLTRLSTAFVKRGRDHLAGGRLSAALTDCLRAEKLAGNSPDIVQLRTQIAERIDAERTDSQQRAEQFARAAEQMQHGWLSTGQKMLAEAEDRQAQGLLKNAELLRIERDAAAKRIEQALRHGQIELAGQLYLTGPLHQALSPESVELLGRIQEQACRKLQTYLKDGRLQAASELTDRCTALAAGSDQLFSLRQAIQLCRQAAGQIQAGEYEAALTALRKLQTILPDAEWVSEAFGRVQAAALAHQVLQAGPLGLFEVTEPVQEPQMPAVHRIKQKQPFPGNGISFKRINEMEMTMRFTLQLDGIGAYYVLCGSRVTVGPVSAAARSDIELVTAPDVRPKQVERIEGDYFLSDVGASSARQLLGDGECVALSPRCRFKFSVPNPASSTACLTPSSARFVRADISGVILMARELLIGPERSSHIQSGQLPEAMTLYVQDGTIRCRSARPVIVAGSTVGARQTLPMDTPIEIGDLRMMLISHND